MANSKQSKKRVRQQEVRRKMNVGKKSAARTAIKKLLSFIKLENKLEANTEMRTVCSKLDRLASKGLIHPNTAARYKSRLNKKVKSITE